MLCFTFDIFMAMNENCLLKTGLPVVLARANPSPRLPHPPLRPAAVGQRRLENVGGMAASSNQGGRSREGAGASEGSGWRGGGSAPSSAMRRVAVDRRLHAGSSRGGAGASGSGGDGAAAWLVGGGASVASREAHAASASGEAWRRDALMRGSVVAVAYGGDRDDGRGYSAASATRR